MAAWDRVEKMALDNPQVRGLEYHMNICELPPSLPPSLLPSLPQYASLTHPEVIRRKFQIDTEDLIEGAQKILLEGTGGGGAGGVCKITT